ncbi:MAG: hypothetical protein ACRDRD_21880, partial [Pseudonocardiaceae bacterium]
AYYHLGSALAAFATTPAPAPPTEGQLRLPTGTERRAHRDTRQFRRHWVALLAAFDADGGPHGWLTGAGTGWGQLTAQVATVHGNGRWAGYKTAELAQKVLGVPTVVADAGHAHSTGPRKGLALLQHVPPGNTPKVIAALDAATNALAAQLGENDIGQVETSLCDFHSLARGHYYLGHDIDQMGAQLLAVPSDLTQAGFEARAASLPAPYLAEATGRPADVDRARARVYADTGRIAVRGSG